MVKQRDNRKGKKPVRQEIEGQIRVNARGYGSLTVGDKNEAIEIEPAFLNTALDGDTVLVSPFSRKKSSGRSPSRNAPANQGEVLKVLKRKRTTFVGVIEQEDGVYYLKPDSRRMYADILITPANLGGAKTDEKVQVEITKWSDPKKDPLGKVIRVIGKAGEHQTEIETIVLESGFSMEYPPVAEEEARAIKAASAIGSSETKQERRDFRGTTTFTIDPKNAKDFDDAISFRRLAGASGEGGEIYEVGVHIADVSHFVRPGMAIDREAEDRATSVYLVDRTIPMLPEVLSNDVCSLVPHEDRLTYSAVFEIDKNGEIKKEWFGRSVINSNRRFTYEEVNDILLAPRSLGEVGDGKKPGPFKTELETLNKIAYALRKQKTNAGAIIFEDEEIEFVLDEKMKPIAINKKVRGDSHKLIEDFMLLANRRVAEYVSRINKNKDNVFVYRVHDVPDREKILDLIEFLRPLGYHLKLTGTHIPQRELNKMLADAAGTPETDMINRATIRTMQKAVYSMQNIGHYGLAFPHYTHFTSPIRRYPDLMVHRLLDIYLAGKRPAKELITHYAELVVHCSDRERQAAEAERESIKFKQVEYMADHVGETFEGVISGVTEFGIFVEELSTKTEGLVKVRDLGEDYFEYDEKNYALAGKKSKKKFRLGDVIKVKVVKADVLSKTVDYELVI